MATDIKLPAQEVFPRGRQFPFSFYSIGGGSARKRGELLPKAEKRADQREILNGGITLIGPQYELNKESIQLAKEFKRHVIYTINGVVKGKVLSGARSFEQFNNRNPMPIDEMCQSIAKQVKNVAGNQEIAYWNITPEELRYWCKNEMLYLKKATETIRANDPLKRPIMMYDPGHRDGKALAKTAKYLDFVAKGMYTNYSNHQNERVFTRHSTLQGIKAREISKCHDLVILALPEMMRTPKNPKDRQLIPVWVRHDVYSALVAGAQGVLVFSASKRPNFDSRQEYLDSYLKVCKELTGTQGLGEVFLFGERRNDLKFQQISGAEQVSVKIQRKVFNYAAVDMANIAYNRLRYIFLVNSSSETVTGVVSGLPYGSDCMVRQLWNDDLAYCAPEGEFSVTLPPLGVAAFIIYRQAQ